MDLLSILPNFPTKSYTHLLPSLERNRLSTVDLITLDTLEIAKRAHLPPTDIRRFSTHVIEALHGDVGFEKKHVEPDVAEPNLSFDGPVEIELGSRTEVDLDAEWNTISTLDDGIDAILGGGLPTGYLCEVTGESGSGKTQFLLTLLLAIQLPPPKGLSKRAIYISTEAPLSTPRLSQILESNPHLCNLPRSTKPNLTNVLSINAMDLETQDHILNYQLPVAIKRYNVGLVIIDSITANYRAEHTGSTMAALSARSGELARLGQMLRNLAVNENVAVVVANQVSDRVSDVVDFPMNSFRVQQRDSGASSPAPRNLGGVGGDSGIPSSSPAFPSSPFVDDAQVIDGVGDPARNEILSLLHQQRFFTGWGDTRMARPEWSYGFGHQKPVLKTPTLGLVWASQIACRIALKKEETPPDLHIDSAYEMSSARVSIGNSQVSKEVPEEVDRKGPSGHDTPADENTQANQSDPPSQQIPIPGGAGRVTRRTLKLVMAPWTAGREEDRNIKDEVDFKIWKGGLSSIHD